MLITGDFLTFVSRVSCSLGKSPLKLYPWGSFAYQTAQFTTPITPQITPYRSNFTLFHSLLPYYYSKFLT